MKKVQRSLPLLSLVLACGEMSPSEQTHEDWIGTTASALCTEGTADKIIQFSSPATFAISPLTTDNYDRSGCSDRWVVEIQGVDQATEDFRVWGKMATIEMPGINQQACSLAFADVQLFEYKPKSYICYNGTCYPRYGWSQYGGNILLQGEWDGGRCRMSVHHSSYPVFQPNAQRTKVRVSVRAYTWALFFPNFKKADAGVHKDVYYFD